MPKRINPIAQYFIYLAATIAAFGVYSSTIVPRIESNDGVFEAPRSPRIAASPVDRKAKFTHLFPVDAWEMGSCKVLETTQGTVLFKDYQPYDDGRVEVFPFTMIIRAAGSDTAKSNAELQPIVLRSSQKAVLQFERAFHFDGGDPGKIQSGQLAGQVSIYRPASADGADDYLKVLTSNVQLEKHRIYTVDDVEFEFGANRGRGRNLSIELSHDTPLDAINSDFSKINGVKKLKLGTLQRMRVQASGGKQPERMLGAQKVPIEIRCAGAFDFDFEKQKATFDDQVIVKQLDNSGQQLECAKLVLMFDSLMDNSQPLVPSQSDEIISQDMQLRRIIATGTPVVLNAPQRQAHIEASYFDYDIALNKIISRGREGVVLQMEDQEFRGSEIEYRIREDGAMGPLLANGAGSMRRNDGESSFTANWAKSLTIEPDIQNRKLITFGGESKLSFGGDTTIGGDDMQVWLWEVAKRQQPMLDHPMNQSNNSAWEYLPHQLLAKGNVVVQSPQLDGTANNLTLRWPAPQTAGSVQNFQRVNKVPMVQAFESNQFQQPAELTTFQSQTELIPIARNEQSQPQINMIQQVGFKQDAEPIGKLKSKFQFEGNAVEVDFSGHERDAKISQLIIEGNVVVRQMDLTDPMAEPVEIMGEQLFMLPQGEDLYRLNVSGNASIVGNGLKLTGPDIHLDQNANRLWVDGAGSMDINQNADQADQVDQTGFRIAPAERSQDVSVAWQGGMIFDGHKMYFEDDVLASGMQYSGDKQSQIRSLSAGLSAMLTNPVSFRRLQSKGRDGMGKVEIQEMILVDRISNEKRVFTKSESPDTTHIQRPVVFEKQDFDEQGQVIARQKMIVPHASVDVPTGNLRASGPGTLMNWQVGSPNSSVNPIRQASAPLGGGGDQNQKTFLRINFDKLLVADAEQGQAVIEGKVRALYAPVDNFEQQFNPDNATRPAGAVKLTCDQMEMAQWQQRGNSEKKSDITAKGNARIVGDQFEATADRLNYDEHKDMLILEGSTRSGANLSFIDPRSQSQRDLVAGRILYRPGDGHTEIQNVQEASMNQKGSILGSGSR